MAFDPKLNQWHQVLQCFGKYAKLIKTSIDLLSLQNSATVQPTSLLLTYQQAEGVVIEEYYLVLRMS